MSKLIPIKEENIASHIYLVRGEKVMFDYDLAMLYGVEAGALKQAVKRNVMFSNIEEVSIENIR